MNVLSYVRAKVGSEEGATATEYVFLVVFIAIVIAVGAGFLGGQINLAFTDAGNSVAQTAN